MADAQRPPRQRLGSNGVTGQNRSRLPLCGSRVGHFVESRMGASTDDEAPPRFPSPLIKPDVPN